MVNINMAPADNPTSTFHAPRGADYPICPFDLEARLLALQAEQTRHEAESSVSPPKDNIMELTESDIKRHSFADGSPTFDRNVSIAVNEPVGSASISPSGRDVVLASRAGLYIIDLDSPWSPPRHLPHHSPWEVADVQWSPFAARDHWVVSTSNQKALVWNLEAANPIEYVLHAHPRAISDINFSAHDPDRLATCAVDSYVHVWDLKRPDRPVMTFADWYAGATQVKWNRQDPNILASTHDKALHVWDMRKGAYPLRTIVAHKTKIYGVDFSRTKKSSLLTCSLDKTIKFWDYEKQEDVPETVIATPFPVWRARHTPFGHGVLAMPQRGDTNLHLYNIEKAEGVDRMLIRKPVHSFEGHTDHVKEFLWRVRGNVEGGIDNRDFQLVSWGTDRHLRLHRTDLAILKDVGYEIGQEVEKNVIFTRQGAVYKTYREDPVSEHTSPVGELTGLSAMFRAASAAGGMGMSKRPVHGQDGRQNGTTTTGMHTKAGEKKPVDHIKWMEGVKIGKREDAAPMDGSGRSLLVSPDQPSRFDTSESLGDEITAVGSKFKKVTFEKVDVSRRTATVTLNGPWGIESRQVFVRVEFIFPKDYPQHATPKYKLLKTTATIPDEILSQLQNELRSIAEYYRLRKRGSLEAIVGYLIGERGLEESISIGSDGISTDDGPNNEESSSDEGEGIGADPGQPTDLDESATDIFSATNLNTNFPLPKTCGGLWVSTGHLVCFFPPKPEAKPLFSLASLRANDRLSKIQKIADGLGRLYNLSPEPRQKMASVQDDEDEDGSWVSTSSSSSSEGIEGGPGRIEPPAAWRGASLRFQRTSQPSSSGYGGYTTKSDSSKPKSLVSLHNMTEILPSKKTLAEYYEISGDSDIVCLHNAEVAKACGDDDLAYVWGFVRMILSKQVPLEVMQQSFQREPILVIARRAIVRIKKKDSGLDLAFDEPEAAAHPKLKGRVKFGNHPGGRWLINQLLNHFEQKGDIQMLAILSCVLFEPAVTEDPITDLVNLRHAQVPIALEAPAFSLDYYSTPEVALSLLQPPASNPSTPRTSDGISKSFLSGVNRRLDTFGSADGSSWGDAPVSDPATPYSLGATPPELSRTNTRASLVNYSGSPEQHTRRSNSNLANAIASLSRPFGMTASASPPDKRDDTYDLSTSAPTSGITWGETTFYGSGSNSTAAKGSSSSRSRSQQRRRTNSLAEDNYSSGSEDEDDGAFHRRTSMDKDDGEVIIKVTLKNQDKFDHEGQVDTPLLDPAMSWKYRSWRSAYTDMLNNWGLAEKAAEMDKFNGLAPKWPESLNVQQGEKGNDNLVIERQPYGGSPGSTFSHGRIEEGEAKAIRSCTICKKPVGQHYRGCDHCDNAAHFECADEAEEEEGWVCCDANNDYPESD